MIKSFLLYRSSAPDFDSPFLCLDLPASNYESEMKRFIRFLFLLLFYYHAVVEQPRLTIFFSSPQLESLSLHLLTLGKQLLSYAKKQPYFAVITCHVTLTSTPHLCDYDRCLQGIHLTTR